MSKGNGKPCIRCNSHDWDSRGSCKECARIRARKWASENKERAYETSKRWRESNAQRWNELQAKSRERHPHTNRTRVKRWQKSNPEKVREHRALRTERESKAGGKHTQAEWLSLLDEHNGLCARCGTQSDVGKDHIIPVVRGGTSDICNIQPLCRACNSHKGTKDTDYRQP